jgi:WD40 repeat protein
LIHHKGFRNKEESIEEKLQKQSFFQNVEKDIFYQFSEMNMEIPVAIQHFQLRKNLKILSNTELIYIRSFGIEKFDLVTHKRQFLVLFDNEENEDHMKVVNFDFCFKEDKFLLVCGKINGCIIIYTIQVEDIYSHTHNSSYGYKKSSAPPCKTFRMRVADEGELQITNHVKFIDNNTKILICSNDSKIKILDLENPVMGVFPIMKCYKAPSAVNNYDVNLSQNILACVGDFETVELFDFKNTNYIGNMKGHSDFGFSCQFQPGSDYILATGNQDYTCRIWDLRKIQTNKDKDYNAKSYDENQVMVKTLYGNFDAIGELQFLNKDVIVYAENTDFLHIYDIKNDKLQSLDYFGSSGGFDIHPITKKIYLAIHEYSHFGIMTYEMIRDNVVDIDNLFI